ncbi:MAG: hypothetical protein GXP42_10650 [Chloroflexi bacterium]|nr:hypothetical protein [Chloroflexota bacterium]
MSTLYLEPTKQAEKTLPLVRSAIEAEIARLELALEMAQKRLAEFEQRYAVSSEEFMQSMTAEDLNGGDDEYVQWAGEYLLMQRLREKLARLREIEYPDSGIYRADSAPR